MRTDPPPAALKAANVAAFPANPWKEGPDVGSSVTIATDGSDPLLDFVSENEASSVQRSLAAKESSTPAQRARVTWIHVAIALLALAVLVQGGLFAAWFAANKQTAAPVPGLLAITSAPAGESVTIDGVARGVTPLSFSLASGSHQVQVGTGSAAHIQTVNVSAGSEASVHVELRPAPTAAPVATTGGLQISTEPAGAHVWVDDEARGTTPLSVADLAPGDHVIRVVGTGGSVTRQVSVAAGTTSSLIISMTAAAEFASGWLAVSSAIAAQIREDSTLLGTSDTPRILLRAGRHTLELTNPALGFRTEQTVDIAAGRTTTIVIEVPRGTMNVNALPWADVWLDGRHLGETPLANVSMPIGQYELLFRHPELGERRQTVIVSAGTPIRVGVDLRKKE